MCLFSLRSRLVHTGSFSRTASSCSQQTTKLTTAPSSSSSSVAGNRKRAGRAYASSAYSNISSAAWKQQRRRPPPRRGQVKAAIFASCLHTLGSIFDGARSAAKRHLHFRWSWSTLNGREGVICTHRTGASSVSDAEKELRQGRRRRRRRRISKEQQGFQASKSLKKKLTKLCHCQRTWHNERRFDELGPVALLCPVSLQGFVLVWFCLQFFCLKFLSRRRRRRKRRVLP